MASSVLRLFLTKSSPLQTQLSRLAVSVRFSSTGKFYPYSNVHLFRTCRSGVHISRSPEAGYLNIMFSCKTFKMKI